MLCLLCGELCRDAGDGGGLGFLPGLLHGSLSGPLRDGHQQRLHVHHLGRAGGGHGTALNLASYPSISKETSRKAWLRGYIGLSLVPSFLPHPKEGGLGSKLL